MKREVFSITTSESYTSVGGLLAQTGQDRKHWRHVALKELVDNALDAAESAGEARHSPRPAHFAHHRERHRERHDG